MLTTKNQRSSTRTIKLHGMVLMFSAILLFTVSYAIARPISTKYPANEMMFFRMLFGLVPAAFAFRTRRIEWKELTIHRLAGHLLRAVTGLGAVGFFIAGLPYLPLSTAVTLKETEAIFVCFFGIVFLAERFRLPTAIASMCGFVGVAVVCSPFTGGGSSPLGIILILLSAMFSAGSVIQVKKLSRSEAPAAIVLYYTVIATIVCGMSLAVAWVKPGLRDFGSMFLFGLTAGVAQLMLTVAIAGLTTPIIASFGYLSIVWATIFDYLIWGEVISLRAAFGSLIIVASVLHLTCRAQE
ncbi:DMT family transporter [Paraburkholderia sp. BR14312]|uniref:DMT family transporter n=2 Tax=unclassified Paraburkholderia TaxID=2615204 RepID=UPI0034CF00EA